jgi:hypothetical protein
LRQVAAGLRIERVEPSTTVGGLSYTVLSTIEAAFLSP